MKAMFLTLALVLTGVVLPYAQTQHRLAIGLRTGLAGSSYFTGKGPTTENRLLGKPYLGAVATYGLTDRLSLQAELNYAPKGDRWSFDGESGTRKKIRDVFNYLEIPVLARYRFLDGPIGAYALGGFYLARALSNRYTTNQNTVEFDDFPRADFGLQLGGGATYPLGPGRAFAELRFSQGFRDLDVFLDGTETRMMAIGLGVGYLYDFR